MESNLCLNNQKISCCGSKISGVLGEDPISNFSVYSVMSTNEFPEPEMAFKCDKCGELFDSLEDAENHNLTAHESRTREDNSEH